MVKINDFVEVSSYQKTISLINGRIDEILHEYSWEDLACHPELKIRAILRYADLMGGTHAEAKQAVEDFIQKLKYIKL